MSLYRSSESSRWAPIFKAASAQEQDLKWFVSVIEFKGGKNEIKVSSTVWLFPDKIYTYN